MSQPVVEVVPIQSLRRDVRLQCRARLDDRTVESYAELLQAGTVMPPVSVVEVEGVRYLVDGWHRVAGAELAKHPDVCARIVVGAWPDAVAAAAGANATHGLPRTNDDKRRALLTVLAEPDLSKGSLREIAALAGVTHTYVRKLRKELSLAEGEVLSRDRLAVILGELPDQWRQRIAAVAQEWAKAGIRQVAGSNVQSLASIWRTEQDSRSDGYREYRAAILARAAELRKDPEWFWGADKTHIQRVARARGLDTCKDLVRALSSSLMPEAEVEPAYLALQAALRMEQKTGHPTEADFAGRPALVAAVRARDEQDRVREAARPRQDYELRNELRQTNAPERAVALLRELAPRGAWAEYFYSLREFARKWWGTPVEDALLEALTGGTVRTPCPAPWCPGWVHPGKATRSQEQCVHCGQTPKGWRILAGTALQTSANLLEHDAYAVRSGDVVVDRHALNLLTGLAIPSEEVRAWLAKAPRELRPHLDAWEVSLGSPERLVTGPPESDDDKPLDQADDEPLDQASA